MDARTPMLILLSTLLAGLALAVLGLSANNVAYAHKHHNDIVEVHYIRWNETASRPYSYWMKMDYTPSHFSMGRTYAMLAAGVICAVAGIAVAATSLATKKSQSKISSLGMMATTSITFIVSLAIAIYAWQIGAPSASAFYKAFPLPSKGNGATTYNAPFDFTFESWNCMLAGFIISPAHSGAQGQCTEAQTAKYIMVPVVILSGLLLLTLAWTWRQANNAAATEVQPEGKEMDEASIQSSD